MSETDRVQRWRKQKSEDGLKACTIWLTKDEELKLKDLAAKSLCSPSKIVQRALAQYQPTKQSSSSSVTDIELLREMIRAEIGAMQAEMAPVTATATDTEQLRSLIQAELAQIPPVTALVTATVTDTVAAILPALVRAMVEELALEARGMPVTATSNSYVTDTHDHEETTASPHGHVTDTNGNVTEIETPAAQTPEVPVRRTLHKLTPMQANAMQTKRACGVPIKMLMEEYGVSKSTVLRYLAEAQPATSPAAPVPARRASRTSQRV